MTVSEETLMKVDEALFAVVSKPVEPPQVTISLAAYNAAREALIALRKETRYGQDG